MSELTLKLIIILIPGAISTLIYGRMILHKEWSNFKFILYSILFGVFSYLSLQTLINLVNLCRKNDFPDLSLMDNLTKVNSIPYIEILLATLISLVLAFLMSYVENKKVLNRFGQFLNITTKYGEENLYSRFLNIPEIEWVHVRVPKTELIYCGWIKSFSESDTVSEIRLADVSVYSHPYADFLYDSEEIYLSFQKHDIIIESAAKINKA